MQIERNRGRWREKGEGEGGRMEFLIKFAPLFTVQRRGMEWSRKQKAGGRYIRHLSLSSNCSKIQPEGDVTKIIVVLSIYVLNNVVFGNSQCECENFANSVHIFFHCILTYFYMHTCIY